MPTTLNMTDGMPISEITLHRGETGLGFNIRGGTDIPHFKEDSGIFVTKLKEAGAAFRDKRLKEGDKILEVNGHNIQSVTHNEAVQIFITAGETVTMKVQHGAEAFVLKKLEDRKKFGSGMIVFLLLLGVAAAAGVGFIAMKNK
ncbi:synaptojanin-2-binding protein [Aplysia californica]|uniref:Synaptojanin-2-binding protein n=1 Tax=Aplysia californica TaxID=6500 RepID=A0ABM0JHH2_APLCA|nr:synaptojanin-2-binding protein [Aplysia californica]